MMESTEDLELESLANQVNVLLEDSLGQLISEYGIDPVILAIAWVLESKVRADKDELRKKGPFCEITFSSGRNQPEN